jgi:hypothetical protein
VTDSPCTPRRSRPPASSSDANISAAMRLDRPSRRSVSCAAPDGRVVYGLKRHWRDGTSAVSFDPLTFIERLAALVPPPRAHQLTYQGVLAPASAWRAPSVLPKCTTAPAATSLAALDPASSTAPSTCARSSCSLALDLGRAPAPRLRRRRRHLPALRRPPPDRPADRPHRRAHDPRHLGHPTEPPRPAPARPREHLDFPEPVRLTAEHAPRPRPAPADRPAPVSTAPAPPTQRASNDSPARHRGPI